MKKSILLIFVTFLGMPQLASATWEKIYNCDGSGIDCTIEKRPNLCKDHGGPNGAETCDGSTEIGYCQCNDEFSKQKPMKKPSKPNK